MLLFIQFYLQRKMSTFFLLLAIFVAQGMTVKLFNQKDLLLLPPPPQYHK